MARPKQSEQIQNLPERIIDTAYRQIAENGAATLSLRAIARELGITTPAIYNYYASRDQLVTALIVEAYTSLAENQRQARTDSAKNDLAQQLCNLGRAYRNWALTYPQRYLLIFGTPIPHYVAPAEITMPAAARSILPLIEVLQDLSTDDRLRTGHFPVMSTALIAMLKEWQAFLEQEMPNAPINLEVLYLGLVIWSRVHGLVMIEIGRQYPVCITDPGELFNHAIEVQQTTLIK
jgi:AcrR family transcriptional regulator